MTATDQMRAMLDQLMGTSRNGEFSNAFFLACARLCVLATPCSVMEAQLTEKKSLRFFFVRVANTSLMDII